METEVRTIREFVDEIGEKYGPRVAYRFFREESVDSRTYKNLRDDVYGLASYFVKRGYKERHIALLGGTSYEWVVSFLAVIVSGNVVIPIDKMLLEEEMMNLFRSGDVDVIFYDNAYEDVAQKAKKNIEQVKSIKDMSARDFTGLLCTKEGKIPDTDIHSVAEILFTSGTTGASKGVMLSQDNIVSNIREIYHLDYASNVDGEKVVLSVLPINHTFELTVDNLGILAYGATICINDKLEKIVDNMNFFKPSVILIVPAIAEVFYKKIKEAEEDSKTRKKMNRGYKTVKRLSKFKIDARRRIFKSLIDKFGGRLTNVVVGGAALRPEICEYFDQFGINVYQGYGLTECAPLVAANNPEFNRVGSVGKPIRTMELDIDNGEVVVKGSGVMLGYYKNEAATKEVIKDGWFHTGDLGHVDEDGFLYITGRCKNIIILDNGKNIYPEELEDRFNVIDGVKDSFVYADKGRLCVLVLPNNPGDREKKKVIENEIKKINESMPTYKKVTFINFTHKEFPKTTTMKIKRHELMKLINEQLGKNEVKYVEPTNAAEKRIVDAYERVLNKKVGILNDFFEMGGDSLSAFEIAAMLGVDAQEIYEFPTPKALARYMSNNDEAVEDDRSVDVNELIKQNANLFYNPTNKRILLTGATGFLGAHILRELLSRNLNVVCLVRNEERLRQTLGRYFPDKYKYFKYKVVKGDIEKPKFGLSNEEYEILVHKVDTVIHTAANVHHAGHYEDFERTNVKGTQNVINFCKDAKAVLHYTSTASVNGVGTVSIPKTDQVFDEFILDIGQDYVQNVYIHSKYKAEEAVLKARSEGLKANIYRIGNLTWRMSDGMFQKNAGDNGFVGRARGLFKARLFSPEIAQFPMDFTAVDECADAYVRLVLHNRINNIYHLYNPHLFTIEKLSSKLLFKCKQVPKELYDKLLKEKIYDKDVAVLSFYSSIASKSRNVPMSNEYTVAVLKDLGFSWSRIGLKYLKYLKRFMG